MESRAPSNKFGTPKRKYELIRRARLSMRSDAKRAMRNYERINSFSKGTRAAANACTREPRALLSGHRAYQYSD